MQPFFLKMLNLSQVVENTGFLINLYTPPLPDRRNAFNSRGVFAIFAWRVAA